MSSTRWINIHYCNHHLDQEVNPFQQPRIHPPHLHVPYPDHNTLPSHFVTSNLTFMNLSLLFSLWFYFFVCITKWYSSDLLVFELCVVILHILLLFPVSIMLEIHSCAMGVLLHWKNIQQFTHSISDEQMGYSNFWLIWTVTIFVHLFWVFFRINIQEWACCQRVC